MENALTSFVTEKNRETPEKIYKAEESCLTYLSPEPEATKKSKGLCAFTNIGAGHGNFAVRLARDMAKIGKRDMMVGEIGEMLWNFASPEEKKAIEQLDFIHRRFLVETIFHATTEFGLKMISKISRSGLVIKNPTRLPDYSSAEKYEEQLIIPFVKMVEKYGLEFIIASHPSAASIAEKAKKAGLLKEDFQIVNCVFDPIKKENMLTSMLYDANAQEDKAYKIFTASKSTAETMELLGYKPEEHVILLEKGEWSKERNEKKEQIIRLKLAELDEILKNGVTPETPLRLALVCDNFSTKHEIRIASEALRRLAPEIKAGLLKISILASGKEIKQHLIDAINLGFSEDDIYIFNRTGLGTQDKNALDAIYFRPGKNLPKIMLINRDIDKKNGYPHEYFMDIQDSVITGCHGAIGRPTEFVRVAGENNTFSLLVNPYGFQEEEMGKHYSNILETAKYFQAPTRALFYMRRQADGLPLILEKHTVHAFHKLVQNTFSDSHYFGEGSGLAEVLLKTIDKPINTTLQ